MRVREQLQRRYGNEGLGGRSLLGIAGYPQSVTFLRRIIHELVARVIGMMAGSRLARHCRSLP